MDRSRRYPGRARPQAGALLNAAFWAALAVLVLIAVYPNQQFALARGAVIAVPFSMAAAWRGWRTALLLAPVVMAAFWAGSSVLGMEFDVAAHVMLVAAVLLATLSGHRLRRVWSAHERRAALSERRATLLQQAAIELNQAGSHDELFEAGLRLLSDILRFDHAEVFVPSPGGLAMHSSWRSPVAPGFEVGLKSVIGRAYRTGELQHVPDTAHDPDFVPVPGSDRARSETEVSLPLKLGEEVVAVLNLENGFPNAFDEGDRSTVRAFARIMEEVLERIAAREQLALNSADHVFFARLSQELLHADNVGQAASLALAGLLTHVPIKAATVVMLTQGRLRPIAVQGELSVDFARHGLPYDGPLKRVWEARAISTTEDVSVLEPTGGGGRQGQAKDDEVALLMPVVNSQSEVQALLIAKLSPTMAEDERVRKIVDTVSNALAASLWRTTLNRRLLAVLEVVRRISRTGDPADLLQQAAEAAVDLIPDAEAASVLVRENGMFRFAGGVGYDLSEVIAGAGPFTLDEQLRWYGDSSERYRRGVARVIRGAAIAQMSFASSPARSPANIKSARVSEMKANVLVPITIDDEVVALLNVDNFSTEHAFGSSAVRVAEAYAQHIAVIVRQAQHVQGLERNLVTDGLTGLGNRVGLQRAMADELERAKRYAQPLNFVMIDLDGFKAINDRFGHAAGDLALKSVAEVLRRQVRTSDLAFRWGGDEFALVLPGVDREEAAAAAKRFAELIGELEVEGQRLRASVGIASFPDDGADPEALLKFADALMYQDKARASRQPAGAQSPALAPGN